MLPGNTPALFGVGASPGNDSFTKLLLHGDGANTSVVIPDNSPSQQGYGSVQGATSVSTNTAKFGTASLLFNVPAAWLFFPNSTDYDFGSGDFTVDWWEYRVDTSDNRPIVCRSATPLIYQQFMFGYTSGGSCYAYCSSDGASWNVLNGLPLGPIQINGWHHVAVVRKGSTFYGFRDGVLQGTQVNGNPLSAGTAGLAVGLWYYNASTAYYFYGYMDELRISKGIARWTANFTPPAISYRPDTAPLPAVSLSVSAPASATSQTAFNVTVTALDAKGHYVANYNGTIHFSASGGVKSLPANTVLSNGLGTFSVTLYTGNWTITATDTVNGSITGTSANINLPTPAAKAVALGSSQTWTVPADWNSANNYIYCIGGGGGGGNYNFPAGGGGGGYAIKYNVALTQNSGVGVAVGGGGAPASGAGNGGTGGTTSFAGIVVATGGVGGGAFDGIGGAGGGAAAGDFGYAGGRGGNGPGSSGIGGGGGGAGGTYGAGGKGGDSVGSGGCGAGGGGCGGGTAGVNGDAGVGVAGAGGNSPWAAGGAGASFGNGGAGTNGSGGGGTTGVGGGSAGVGGNGPDYSGGGGGSGGNGGGHGGYYGGGGGAGNFSAGTYGQPGVIYIWWQPA